MSERLALSLPEAAKALGISETHARVLARRGEIPAMRLGSRWIVPLSALHEFLHFVTVELPIPPAKP